MCEAGADCIELQRLAGSRRRLDLVETFAVEHGGDATRARCPRGSR
jgi:hypothetical protein